MATSESPILTSSVNEVWKHNVAKELHRLSLYTKYYNVVSINTVFPGSLYREEEVKNVPKPLRPFELMARNVKENKLIQLEISIATELGDTSIDGGVWLFNFRFDTDLDNTSVGRESALNGSGMEGECLRTERIPHTQFFNALESSGLFSNPELRWVSYNGLYDFGYLVKHLCGNRGLQNARVFQERLQKYFPKRYDVKVLALGDKSLPRHGGLYNLAIHTQFVGDQNNVWGPQSSFIRHVFTRLMENYDVNQSLASKNGVLFGTPRFYYRQLADKRVANRPSQYRPPIC